MNKQKNKIMLIDYGSGNLRSVLNALTYLKCDTFISSKKEDVKYADAFILPGVGAFGHAIENLEKMDLIDVLSENVLKNKKPFLGICLGMQLLAEFSEEKGRYKGLGWIPGTVVKLDNSDEIRLPHIGWNNITVVKRDPLLTKIEGDMNFYHVHSYHFACKEEYISATSKYGATFTSAVQKDNIFGVQFHPEKSQSNGLKLLRNYINYVSTIA